MIKRRPKSITILEGPDGGGKTTLATELLQSRDLNARLIHCGPYPHVRHGLGRLYVEAMLPALLGYQNIILDRSWLSEGIYGRVRREGKDRLGEVGRRMLERVAARCETRVILCLPPVDTCLASYRERPRQEYLEHEVQLRKVHHLYQTLQACRSFTSLPIKVYNYEARRTQKKTPETTCAHPLNGFSAGNLRASVVLVGDTFAAVKEDDPLFRAPFVSFNDAGCSMWLTRQLIDAKISEHQLLWVNSDDPLLMEIINAYKRDAVIALGKKATDKLTELKQHKLSVQHPQHAKRFYHKEQYKLITYLKRLI